MHQKTIVSRSVLALLALPMAHAFPVSSSKTGRDGLVARHNGNVELTERTSQETMAVTVQRRASEQIEAVMQAARAVGAPEHANTLMLRDLHRRGILDTLVNALAAVLTELLGTDGASARHYRRQLTSLGAETGGLVDKITCLILKLIGINDASCSGSARRSDVSTDGSNSTASATATSSAPTSSPSVDAEAVRQAVTKLVQQVEEAMQQAESGTSASSGLTDSQRRDILLARQGLTGGVQGILEVLRELLDTLLNTLLPLSSRSTDSTSSAPAAKSTDCPAPGTPNDGQYRPGCPGYGRRDLSERDLDLMEVLVPAIQMLMKQLESLSGSDPDSSSSGTSTASSATPSKTTSGSAGSAESSASTPGSLLSLFETRDLLDADGFQFVKRNMGDAEEHHGLNERDASKVNDVLGRVFAELAHKREEHDGLLSTRTVDAVVNKVWAPSMSRRMFMGAASRSIDAGLARANRVLAARADFKPVWKELKHLGNKHFASRDVSEQSGDAGKRDAAQASPNSFAPVWSSFRDMIDNAIENADKGKNQDGKRSAPVSPQGVIDVKPFTAAASKWFNHAVLGKSGGKRDVSQFRPLADAAGNFAKQQMKEWTAALKGQ